MTFALFFLAEYSHIIIMSLITVLLFFGGWLPFTFGFNSVYNPFLLIPAPINLALKTSFFVFTFVWVRASFPRCRYDALMQLLWKSYLPLSLGFLIFVSSIILIFS
jgi:NADH-quinone oxidoreductase subunit H